MQRLCSRAEFYSARLDIERVSSHAPPPPSWPCCATLQCNRFGTHIQNHGDFGLYTSFTFVPLWNRLRKNAALSESFHRTFTIIRLYLGESLNGISIIPSISPICRFWNTFQIYDFNIDDSMRGIHIAFDTIDIFVG